MRSNEPGMDEYDKTTERLRSRRLTRAQTYAANAATARKQAFEVCARRIAKKVKNYLTESMHNNIILQDCRRQ